LLVYADASLLRRIFQNLIANAIDHTPAGEIIIEAKESADKSSVECIVRDNGEGILPERFQTIFNKNETDSEKDGLGLGLAIVKTFVEAHDGLVTVESEIGNGTTFRFNLPNKAK
jgi:two-component system, OmpR family, phosphate regulon sensor histidine kinase PhoR